MKRVKLFSGYWDDEIESQIDRWIDGHSNWRGIISVSSSISSVTNTAGITSTKLVAVLYDDGPLTIL